MQEKALLVTLLIIAILCAIFYFIISNSGKKSDLEQFAARGYAIRNQLFAILILSGFIISTLTLPSAFEPIKAWAGISNIQTVHVEGYQWYWDIDIEEVSLDSPVEFIVTSGDVTHGFGLYDEDLNMIAQTQVMPGYTNRVNVTFEKAGVYQILCMEYCGLAHHDMVGEITVIDPDAVSTVFEGEE